MTQRQLIRRFSSPRRRRWRSADKTRRATNAAAYALTALILIHPYVARTRLPQLFLAAASPGFAYIQHRQPALSLAVTVICFRAASRFHRSSRIPAENSCVGASISTFAPPPGGTCCSACIWACTATCFAGFCATARPGSAVALGAMTAYGLYIAGARNFYLKLAALYLKHPKPGAERNCLFFFGTIFVF